MLEDLDDDAAGEQSRRRIRDDEGPRGVDEEEQVVAGVAGETFDDRPDHPGRGGFVRGFGRQGWGVVVGAVPAGVGPLRGGLAAGLVRGLIGAVIGTDQQLVAHQPTAPVVDALARYGEVRGAGGLGHDSQ